MHTYFLVLKFLFSQRMFIFISTKRICSYEDKIFAVHTYLATIIHKVYCTLIQWLFHMISDKVSYRACIFEHRHLEKNHPHFFKRSHLFNKARYYKNDGTRYKSADSFHILHLMDIIAHLR